MDFLDGKIQRDERQQMNSSVKLLEAEGQQLRARPLHTEFGWSWGEQQVEYALPLQGTSLTMLKAFIKTLVEEEVEAKMATMSKRNWRTDPFLTSEASTTGTTNQVFHYDNMEDDIMASISLPSLSPALTLTSTPATTPSPTPAHTPSPTPTHTPAHTPSPTPAHTPSPTPATTLSPTPAPQASNCTTSSSTILTGSSAGGPLDLCDPQDLHTFIPNAPKHSESRVPHLNRALNTERTPQQPGSLPPRVYKSKLPSPVSAKTIMERHRARLRREQNSTLLPHTGPKTAQENSNTHLCRESNSRLPFLARIKARLEHIKANQTKEDKSGLAHPAETTGIPESHSTPLSVEEPNKLPLLVRARAILDRYKARLTKDERSGLPTPLRAESSTESHSTPLSEEQNSTLPHPMNIGPKQKSQRTPLTKEPNSRLPPLASTGINAGSKIHAPKPPTTERKKGSVHLKRFFSSKVAPCPVPVENSDELSLGTPSKTKMKQGFFPFVKPQAALDQSFQLLSSEDWEKRIEGLNCIRRLAQCHPETLAPELHKVCLLVVQEVQNLRSLVSRAAVATLGDLFLYLQCSMDPELDWTTKALLQKAGESNSFVRQDVGVALGHMLQSCSPAHCMKALLNGGLSDRNVAVRECNARQLAALVEIMGAPRLLKFKKERLNNFLSAASRLPKDASQEVRNCGKRIIRVISAHKDLNTLMMKFHS